MYLAERIGIIPAAVKIFRSKILGGLPPSFLLIPTNDSGEILLSEGEIDAYSVATSQNL